ncbi:ABC transporter substrate-binding protein [Maritimibacter sp. 55A14]|uniref:ABC transporter substrate-binding protein n=1 Tax=Maritimibacter sp. 55A14 TaxID=2174844 RepID=UPI000D614138|nr:ABC transporter substrate-binding protein [Maritimibacter sp. 55A14]PWE33263.1 ABC transporter substrate-binding protein [Maritimibacter sp. 55A14]
MPVSARRSDLCALLAALGFWLGAALPAAAAPERVVSMNLCTDQMAMLLAAPGQLVSVSHLAADPMSSAMADAARAYPLNRGQAERIFLMKPDLVLAGSYTAQASVDMLRRLGIRVEVFPPETSFADARAHLRRMGRLLEREAEAAAMIADFDARLAALRARSPDLRPEAVLYGAGGYTSGNATLAGEILDAAGYTNLAAALGRAGGGALALEELVLARPDLVVTPRRYGGQSRSEALLDHPALRRVAQGHRARSGARWVCGTPHLLGAVAGLVRLREAGR